MNTVRAAAETLTAALKSVPGVRHYPDPAATIVPPGTVLGPPALTWESYCPEPTEAAFIVWLVVDANDRALERLWDLVEAVSDVVDETKGAAVTRADPATFPSGGTELPAYQITVNVALGGVA